MRVPTRVLLPFLALLAIAPAAAQDKPQQHLLRRSFEVGRSQFYRDTTETTTATKFKGGFSPTAIPQVVTYDPTLGTQDKSGVDVTVTNQSGVTWLASDVVLRYRWYSPDATPATC